MNALVSPVPEVKVPRKRTRPYVGIVPHTRQREVFHAATVDRAARCAQYAEALGPFKTLAAAKYAAARTGPLPATVRELEREAERAASGG